MHSPLVSKIRCLSPNMKGKTAVRNYNYLYYIATRAGVDISHDKMEKYLSPMDTPAEADNETYMKYIHERPRSHGAFGNIDIPDINALCKHVKSISTDQPIFRGIISLSGEDAKNLGYNSKEKWAAFLQNHLPDVGHTLGIDYKDLVWVAAFHNEPAHPHVHYMLWSKDANKPVSPFISLPKQHKCRELLSQEVFKEDYQLHQSQKNLFRDILTTSLKDTLQKDIQGLDKVDPPSRISEKIILQASQELLDLSRTLPNKGKLYYKLLPPKAKEAVGEVLDLFLSKYELANIYEKYIDETVNMARTYSPTEARLNIVKEQAIADIRARLCNIILKGVSKVREAEKLYTPPLSPNTMEKEDLCKLIETYQNTVQEQPDAFSYYKLGELYSKYEATKNIERSIEYYQASATLGNKYAFLRLGQLYLFDKDFKGDKNEGIKYLKQAEEQNCPGASESLERYQNFVTHEVHSTSYSLFYSLFYGIMHARNENQTFFSQVGNTSIKDNKKAYKEMLHEKYGNIEKDSILDR